jgi:hypothetical protein
LGNYWLFQSITKLLNYSSIQLEHFWQGIGVDLEGVVVSNEDGRPPTQRAAGTFLNAGSTAYTAVVGYVLASAGIFSHFNADRAVIAANSALNATAGISRHLV